MAKTKEAADRIGVTTATIRNWTGERGPYFDFVSKSARGGGGYRQFTDHDIRILAAIKALSDDGLSPAEIAANLETMRAAGWPDLPPLPPLPGHDNEVPMVTADAASGAIERTRDVLTAQIRALEGQIAKLEDQLAQERKERGQLQQRLDGLIDQRGQLAGQLQQLDTSGQRERQLYRAALIAAAVLALVLLAAVLVLALAGG